jgi:hypothetical protein
MKSFAVIVPIGPGAAELQRFHFLIDSLWDYEPAARLCVAIDSSPYPRNVAPRDKHTCRFVTLHAPFHGQGEPLLGRLSASLLVGFDFIRRAGPFDFVLRADTDALITGRFRDTVSRFLALHPETGMLGTLGLTCYRESPHYGRDQKAESEVVSALAGDAAARAGFRPNRCPPRCCPPKWICGERVLPGGRLRVAIPYVGAHVLARLLRPPRRLAARRRSRRRHDGHVYENRRTRVYRFLAAWRAFRQ